MKKLTENKKAAMLRLSNESQIIGALAIDQRGALKKMLANSVSGEVPAEMIVEFKELVSKELTPYASSILLDPEFGLPAGKIRAENAGLLLAYEKTGYDAAIPGRLPDSLNDWSVKRLKEAGADACKFLLYYDVDEDQEINEVKHAYMERIGSECVAEDLPFYLEVVSYDANNSESNSIAYAKVKPHKVNQMMKEFSKDRYNVDVLKVEVPVNMNFVEGYGSGEVVYTQAEASRYFKEQSEATTLPYIFLSAGVSASLFQKTLRFAKAAGSDFNGVLCGRATWADGVAIFANQGVEATIKWLRDQGRKNLAELNEVLKETATPWTNKLN